MRVLAIDPGPKESAWCWWDGWEIGSGMRENAEMLDHLRHGCDYVDYLAVEMIASYGKPVGQETFDTCVWIGRFQEAWSPRPCELVFRLAVKQWVCHSGSAKDPHIRQALIDRFGKPGTKKAPGMTYGVKSHQWQALALAVTVLDSRLPAAPRAGRER